MKRFFILIGLLNFFLYAAFAQNTDSLQYRIHLGYFPQGIVNPDALYFNMDLEETNGIKTTVVSYADGALAMFSSPLSSKKDCSAIIEEAESRGLYNLFITIADENKVMLENEVWRAQNMSFIEPKSGNLLVSQGVLWKGKYNAHLKRVRDEKGSENREANELYKEDADNAKFEASYANDQITVEKFKWYASVQKGDSVHFTVPITNYSDKVIKFNVSLKKARNIYINPYFQLPESSVQEFKFVVQAESGEQYYPISLLSDSITIDLMVRVFGYDLSSEDFDSDRAITLHSPVYYYRTGSESTLKFYDPQKEMIKKQLSLTTEKTLIDLSDLEVGTYWVEKISFKDDKSTFTKVVIQ